MALPDSCRDSRARAALLSVLLALLLLSTAAEEPAWTVPVAHSGALVLAMRLGASALWPTAYDPTQLGKEARNLKIAFTQPPDFRPELGILRSDGDPWALNVFAHGAFGSEVYLRSRQCGHGAFAALAGAAAVSTLWEYALEGPYKRPSAIDLVWTPLAGGLVLGEGRFRLYKWLSEGGPVRRALRWAVDPLGEIERGALRTRC